MLRKSLEERYKKHPIMKYILEGHLDNGNTCESRKFFERYIDYKIMKEMKSFNHLLDLINKLKYTKNTSMLSALSGYNFNRIDNHGRTILHRCVNEKRSLCFMSIALLSFEVLDSQDEDGNTALHLCKNFDNVITLLSLGADPFIVNNRGKTFFD